MQNIIVDSSVVIKWYFETNEEDLVQAQQILQLFETGSAQLVAPQVILLELANAAKFAKKKQQEECLAAISSFNELLDEFALLPSMDLIVDQIYNHGLTSYDAVFTALANKMDVPLITADYMHHKKSISKNIIWLKEWKGKL